MSDNSDSQSPGWVKKALDCYRRYGFEIVLLEPLPGVPKDLDDPVVKQLGSQPLVHRIVGAASTESEIEKLGEHFEEAQIGARTGEGSDLLAVELFKAGGWEETTFYKSIKSFTEGVVGVTNSTREYALFPYPNVKEPLPEVTEKKGVVLHGQDSLIHLPGGTFEWKEMTLDDGETVFLDERRKRAREIVKLFGLEDHLAPKEEETVPEKTDTDPPINRKEGGSEDTSQLTLPLDRQSAKGHAEERANDSLFRSGDKLKLSSGRKNGRLNVPWVVPGGFSILTGPPKTTGKSSLVLNLALHLSAGEPFLGFENPPSEVVLLADTSPANFRELLAQASFVDSNGALSHLHVLHPSDVVRLDWQSTLTHAYKHVKKIGADLLIVDCLDRYVRLKGGHRPTESEEVVHKLTAESPSECPVLGVKSTDCTPEESMSATIDRLGLLGVAADAILRMDDISMETFPCLRRLSTVSRRGSISQTHFCSLRSGRYVRVRQSDVSGLSTQNLLREPAHPGSLAGRSPEFDPPLPS